MHVRVVFRLLISRGVHWAYRHRCYRVNDCQETIQRHQHERVHTRIGRDYNQVLYDLAPDVSKRPERQHVVGAGERNTEHNEEQICHGQIDDQEIGSTAHLLVGSDDQHHL